ncbi:MAG: prephenate dehydrogenase/arogenate dehydrogenase family protein [Gammaproteobacteria bacterium]|nr:prephenate dehydrogenase/arogenate dehydrogenase family protein [Gammaproteobacteria bacterium]
MHIDRLCIVGVGLIGGSLARAARRAGVCGEIVGAGRHAGRLRRAFELGVIDAYDTDVAAAAHGADMIVVAVPLGATEAVLEALRASLAPEAVVTDVGSAKTAVVEAARRAFGAASARFVPGHPIAGTECSGVEASFAELFDGARVILTPSADTAPEAIERVQALWQTAGARVERMDAAHHDEVLAATSHLPHLLAFALVDSLSRREEHDEIFRYAAGGFRDFTRIASSDPVMWRDICLANREAVLAALGGFEADLQAVTRAVEAGDGPALEALFRRAKAARDRYLDETGEGSDGEP